MDKALNNQHIISTPSTFFQEPPDPIFILGQVTCLQMLKHLCLTYGMIMQANLYYNENNMANSWNPPTPIENLFDHFRVRHEVSTEVGDAPSAPQLVHVGYNIIQKTSLFDTTCCEWQEKPMSDKTTNCLKSHFNKWDNYRQLNATSRLEGCHGSHHMDTAAPLPNPVSWELI